MKPQIKAVFALVGILSLANAAFAARTTTEILYQPAKVYLGVFGGGGSSEGFSADQYGTALFSEAVGGALSVNAFGHIGRHSTGYWGAQLGYQAAEISFNTFTNWIGASSDWQFSVIPATEIEGIDLGKNTFTGSLFNNTARLPEHDFDVSFPMRRGAFLVNAVMTFNQPCLLLRPYVGVGIGGAIVKITGADSLQIAPPEAGVNHFNTNPSDMDTTFAGQVKVGLSYDVTSAISIFAEYRWLYVGNTHFTFGSTVAPGHAETTSWNVNLDAQNYNLGNIGIRVNL